MNLLDQEWETVQLDWCLDLALEGAYYVLGFTLVLHREELPLAELRFITTYWTQSLQHKKPHIVITLLGHFKNEVGESYHLMHVLFTNEPGKCVNQGLEEYQRKNIQSGYMIWNQDGTKMKTDS